MKYLLFQSFGVLLMIMQFAIIKLQYSARTYGPWDRGNPPWWVLVFSNYVLGSIIFTSGTLLILYGFKIVEWAY